MFHNLLKFRGFWLLAATVHPGGADLLLEYGGANATQPFLALHEHSDIAHEIMERCYVGDVWECDSQSDTSLDSTDTSPSGSSDSGDEAGPSGEQSNNPSRSTSGAGPSSDEPSSSRNASNSRNQSNGGLAAEILTRLRASVRTNKCGVCERKQGNDTSALVFTLSLLAVGTIIFYRLTRS